MKKPNLETLKPEGSQIRVGMLIWAAVLAMIGLLMVIIPLAGSASLRGILVLLFLATGSAMIALSVWLARNPEASVADAKALLKRPKTEKKQKTEQPTA